MRENPDYTPEQLPVDERASASDSSIDAGNSDSVQMGYDRPPEPPARGFFNGRSNRLLWLFAAAALVGIVVFGIVLFIFLDLGAGATPTPSPTQAVAQTTSRPTATRTPTATPTPTVTPTPTSTPDVILLGIKALGELSTVQYNLETVVDKHAQQSGVIVIGGIEIWRPRLHFLLVAGGRVKAGVDFREMVRYEIVDDRVTVYLSAPRVTDYYVDARGLQLYYIRTDFGLDEKFVVEKYHEAIVEAQESLRSAALESDILDAAKTNATALVQSLILGLGFSEVEVKFMPSRVDEPPSSEVPSELIPTLVPFTTATPGG